MKLNWNAKYTTICVYAFLTAAACICFDTFIKMFPQIWQQFLKFLGIISPFIYGFVIAYLLSPTEEKIAHLIEKLLDKREKAKQVKKANDSTECNKKKSGTKVRILSVSATYIVFLLVIAIVFGVLVPQVIVSISEIGENFKGYTKSAIMWLENALAYFGLNDISQLSDGFFGFTMSDVEALLEGAMNIFNKYSPGVVAAMEGFLTEFMNFFIGIVISVYMLAGKNKFGCQLKKLLYALFPRKTVLKICTVASEADDSFGKYINGQIVDSVIVGVVWFVIAFAIGLPYPFLISVIIGITNMIPFFGPFIGGIPTAILVFLAKPQMTLLFVVLLLVVQQLDGNLLAPKIIGQSTGVSPFWVIFSILVMGDYFGIVGLVIAVPLFSLVYKELKAIMEARLAKKGLPVETKMYENGDFSE